MADVLALLVMALAVLAGALAITFQARAIRRRHARAVRERPARQLRERLRELSDVNEYLRRLGQAATEQEVDSLERERDRKDREDGCSSGSSSR